MSSPCKPQAHSARYGIPSDKVSDQGPQFTSTQFHSMVKKWGTVHTIQFHSMVNKWGTVHTTQFHSMVNQLIVHTIQFHSMANK